MVDLLQHGSKLLAFTVSTSLAACSAHEPARPMPPQEHAHVQAEFAAFDCAAGLTGNNAEKQTAKRAASLRLSFPASYLVVRRRNDVAPATLAERGTACSGQALSRASCEEALERLDRELQERTACADAPCGEVYALTEQDGKIEGFRDAFELVRLLHPIDSAEEAWLIAQATLGIPGSTCGDVEQAAFRLVPAGYELRYRYASRVCEGQNPEISQVIALVSSQGETRVLKRELIQSPPTPCTVPSDESLK